jgi:uncharacterized repeat protein (TIGR01451 family)
MMRDVRPSTVAVSAARLLVGVLAVLGVLLPGAVAAQAKASPTPAAGRSPQPSLTIAISDNVGTAAAGDTLVYTVTVGNAGDGASGQVPLKLMLPSGVSFVSADSGGVNDHGSVSWKVSVPAAGHVTVRARGSVGTPAAGLTGLAGVACVNAGRANMLCSSDIDQIPGRGDARPVTRAGAHIVPPGWHRWWLVAVWAVVVAVVGGVLLLLQMRRRLRARAAR